MIALCTCEEKISVFIYEIILQRLNNTKFPSHLLDFEILLVIYHVAVCLDSFNNKIKSQQKLFFQTNNVEINQTSVLFAEWVLLRTKFWIFKHAIEKNNLLNNKKNAFKMNVPDNVAQGLLNYFT